MLFGAFEMTCGLINMDDDDDGAGEV